jgi:hypothetical protein
VSQEGSGGRRVELASGGRWLLGGLGGELGDCELGGGDFGDRFHQDDGLGSML